MFDALDVLGTVGKPAKTQNNGLWKSVETSVIPNRLDPVLRSNVKQKDGFYFVDVALPGVNKSDIDITLERNVLTISGGKEDKENGLIGEFFKSFTLPHTVDDSPENAEASLDKGVLTVKLPVRNKSSPEGNRIEIK